MTDSITGMWNRVKFYKEAQEILEKNKDRTYLMITLDINKFKFINNDFGSKAGDCILCVMGERIQEIFKERGYTARGGEYLLLVIPFIYYTGKRIAEDWIVELRELWRGRQ